MFSPRRKRKTFADVIRAFLKSFDIFKKTLGAVVVLLVGEQLIKDAGAQKETTSVPSDTVQIH